MSFHELEAIHLQGRETAESLLWIALLKISTNEGQTLLMGKEQIKLDDISRMFMHSNISGWKHFHMYKQNPHIQPPYSHDIITSHFQRSYIDFAQSRYPGRGK